MRWSASQIKPIHKARVPLKGNAYYVACCFYVTVPLTGLWYILQWAGRESQKGLPALIEMKKEAEQRAKEQRETSSQNNNRLQEIMDRAKASDPAAAR